MSFSEIINPAPGSIFWTLITFIVLVIVLRIYVWGPLIGGLRRREEGIRQDIDDARQQHEEAEQLRQRNEELLLAARGDAQGIVSEAKQRARDFEEEQKNLLTEEVVKLRERALAEIEQESRQVMEQVREQAVDLVTAATRSVLAKSLGDTDREQIVRQTLDELKP